MFWARVQDLFQKFVKFGIVGVTGTLIDFSITYVSKEVFKTNKYVANALGFSISATNNYILNRYWTFHSKNPNITSEFLHFLFVSILGLGINSGVLKFLHHYRKQNFYLAKLIATGITVFWNFVANTLFTF